MAAPEEVVEYKRQLGEPARDARGLLDTWGLIQPPKPATSNYAKLNYLWYNNAVKAHLILGGQEAVGTLLRVASIDVDGDGNISSEEMKAFTEKGNVILETRQSFLLNAGGIAGLTFSVLFPVL